MFKAAPRSIVYAQLISGMSFIGRLPISWIGDEKELKLNDALQIINVSIPMPHPQGRGVHIATQPSFVPVNHLEVGPADDFSIPYELVFTVVECDVAHPLVALYVKQTSRIEVATTSGIVAPGR